MDYSGIKNISELTTLEGLEDKREADEEEVYASGWEKEVVAATGIVDTCVSSSWSIVFTLRLRKLQKGPGNLCIEEK